MDNGDRGTAAGGSGQPSEAGRGKGPASENDTSQAAGTGQTHARAVGGLLAVIRRTRFGARSARCPRCGHRRFHRWGRFSGRQRYRCLACNRTFSDLTGTPLAYTKHLAVWEPYVGCLVDGLSVRAAGHRVGIDKSTAFRWRHRLLGERRRRELPVLTGEVDLVRIRFPCGRKGRPRIGPRGRQSRILNQAGAKRRMWGLLAHVRSRDTAWELPTGPGSGFRSPSHGQLRTLLLPIIRRPCIIRAEPNPYLRLGEFCRGADLPLVLSSVSGSVTGGAPPPSSGPTAAAGGGRRSGETARTYFRRFLGWLDRFRGVTCGYLPNYFAWHRMVERIANRRSDRLRGHPTSPDPDPMRRFGRQFLIQICAPTGAGRP